jgi:serine protease Do
MNSVNVKKQSRVGRRVLTVIFLAVFIVTNATFAQSSSSSKFARELSDAFATAAKEAMPAVVSIKVEKTIVTSSLSSDQQLNDPFGLFGNDFLRQFFGNQIPQQLQTPRKYIEEGQGSGFIISKDGYILTNNHVVGNVDKITVELQDGRTFHNAKVIGTDPGTEVALIKIEGDDFPVLPMGNSKNVEIGDWVIAIGNPFGLSETVTVGVISAVGRSNVHIAAYEDFIQTDAAINPGNSGGPLVNLEGQAVGINTAIYSESGGYMGIGFAIPIDMARNIEEQLKEYGRVIRGYLGLLGDDVTPDMAELLGTPSARGIIISTVEKGSPADKAGLKSGDIITEMDGKKIESYDAFRNDVADMKPDSKLNLTISREGETQKITVTLGERPSEVAKTTPQPKPVPRSKKSLGVDVQNVTSNIARQLNYPVGEGVIVTGVAPASPANYAGIQPGDVIESVNGQKVNSVDEFENAMNKVKGNKVLLLVRHGEYSQFVVVTLTL